MNQQELITEIESFFDQDDERTVILNLANRHARECIERIDLSIINITGDDGSYYTELRSYNRDLQAQKEAIIKELEGK